GVQQSGHRRSSSRLNVLQPVCQQIGTIRREVRLAYGAVWRRAPCSSRCLTRHHETEETLRAAMASRPDRPSGRHHHDAEPVHCDEAVASLKKASNYRHLTRRDLAEDIAGRADLQPAFTRRRLITTRDDPSRPLLAVFEHRSSSWPRHPRTRQAVTMPPFTSPLPPTSAPPGLAPPATGPRSSRRAANPDGAAGLFAEYGYHGSSLRDISHQVGISHPGMLHHFASKDALLGGVIDRLEAHAQAALDRVEELCTDPEVFVRALA